MTTKEAHNKFVFTKRDIEQLEQMAKIGLPHKHMGAIIGCSADTIERHAKTNEALAAALERGAAEGANLVYKAAQEMASSGRCPVMTIFWLKVREGWRESDPEMRDLKDRVVATTENVAKLYEIATKAQKRA